MGQVYHFPGATFQLSLPTQSDNSKDLIKSCPCEETIEERCRIMGRFSFCSRVLFDPLRRMPFQLKTCFCPTFRSITLHVHPLCTFNVYFVSAIGIYQRVMTGHDNACSKQIT